jgi:hypothetical protein
LKKLEGFARMNARQLLEVATRFLSIEIRRIDGRPTGR